MKRALIVVNDAVLATLVEIVSLLLSLFVPLVCLFARWDAGRTTWTGGAEFPEYPTWRGDLPRWAYIWSTPDERLPGDVRMPQTRAILDWTTGVFGQRVGRYMTSVWWLWRNRMYGLTWLASATPFDHYIERSQTPGIVWDGGLWRWWTKLGPVELNAGWKVHRANDVAHWQTGPFVAVRFVSIKKAR